MLKLVSGRMKGQAAAGPHPAPELLAAFAENALPGAERGQLLQHLGGCSDCREILYLALPEAPETQKVLVPPSRPLAARPAFSRAFRRWVVGWGALAASVAIGVYFTTNRLEHRNQLAAKVTSAPALANENETKIAADKTPAELDQLGARRDAAKSESIDRNMAVALDRSEREAQPEAKHMTGKMQSQLVFEDSGQVHLQAPAAPPSASGRMASVEGDDRKKESSGQATGAFNAPSAGKSDTPGYAGGGLSKARADQDGLAGQSASSVADSASELKSSPAEGRNVRSPMPMAIKSAKGTLGGTIVDSAGAVVANAKVTVAGPTGEKAATSDAEGKFSFDPLPPGSYSVKAEASGFKPTELKPVAVLGDLPATVQVRLEPGSVSEAVEVTSAAPEVAEANTTQQAGSGTSLEIVVPAQRTSGLNKQKSPAQASRQRNAIVSAGTVSPVLQWTLSPEGVVQRSGDGGKTWRGVSVASGVAFRALSAVGPNIWVGGKAGVLYHSADFGQSWAQSEPMAGRKKLDQDIVRVDFSSALNGTLNAANGEVWATSDGGRTWLRK